MLSKSLAHVHFTLTDFTSVYYHISQHLSIHKENQSSKKCALHCRSEEPITTSRKSLSKSAKCKASKKVTSLGYAFSARFDNLQRIIRNGDHDHYVSITQVLNGCVLHVSCKNKEDILRILDLNDFSVLVTS